MVPCITPHRALPATTQAVLKPLADKLTFYDIFNAADVANCKAPFKLSNKGGKVECLQVSAEAARLPHTLSGITSSI